MRFGLCLFVMVGIASAVEAQTAPAANAASTSAADKAPGPSITDAQLTLMCNESVRSQLETGAPDSRSAPVRELQDKSRPELRDKKCTDSASRRLVCDAYRRHAVMPWDAARELSGCVGELSPASVHTLNSLRPSPPSAAAAREDDTTPLSGASLESAILYGTAEFILQRGEEELALFASQVMSDELCEKPTIKGLLSRTCALIGEDATEGGENKEPLFAVTLAALREALRADLEALPKWLATELGHDPKQVTLACAMEVGWSFSDRVLKGDDVVATLSDLGSLLDPLEKEAPCNAANSFTKLLREISQSIHDASNTDGVNVEGLVRAGELDSVVSRAAKNLTAGNQLSNEGKRVREVLRRIRELERAIDTLDKEPTGSNRAAVIVAALRTIEPLLTYAAGNDANAASYMATVSEIVTDVGSRQYIAAVVALSSSKLLTDALGPGRVGHNFRVLVTLSATIAQADSSDAVKAALEEAAAPLQTWRRKNMENYNGATITGLPGLTGGYEIPIEKTRGGKKAPNGGTFAPTLMLGVDLHHGFGGWRLGALVNVLDLGALATVRTSKAKSDTDSKAEAQQEPEVRFEQVFAPGLYPYIGFGPFDLGVGVGFVPSLRPARDGDNSKLDPLNVMRVNVFIAVDVSILPLF